MSEQLVVMRRIRNRVIEYLEVAASPSEQRRYEAAVPFVHVPNEMINQWEDWVRSPEEWPEDFPSAVYSSEEVAAVESFHATWDSVASRTPNPMPSLSQLQRLPVWMEFCEAAEEALLVFMRRGKLSE